MDQVIDLILHNKEWLALGIILVGGALSYWAHRHKGDTTAAPTSNVNTNTLSVSVHTSPGNAGDPTQSSDVASVGLVNNRQPSSMNDAKAKTRILFIDDQTGFAVVKILKQAGWVNTRAVRDITSLDASDVVDTHIFFVDIQGVGKALNFRDEGLGLATALKQKYPDKKVVIYSAEDSGDRFHAAFRIADDQLRKNAETYEFQQ